MNTKKPASAGMDLSDIGETVDTSVLAIRHPRTDEVLMRDDGDPMTITVLSPLSDKIKKLQNAQANRQLEKAMRAGRVKMTVEQSQANELEITVASVEAWTIVENGVTPPVTPGEVKALFKRRPWIRDQVEAHRKDAEHFLAN